MKLIREEAWSQAYPDACIGILLMRNAANVAHNEALDARRQTLEERLRKDYGQLDRAGLRALPTISAYRTYYKRFRKTYHVELQVESIVHKGRSIPSVSGLVQAMFMAELENQMLTAGHDADGLVMPVRVAVAHGDEQYVTMGGRNQTLKPGDMYIADGESIMSSVLYGPDQRTQIQDATRRVLYTVYGPPGIAAAAVERHLGCIREYVQVLAPEAVTETLCVWSAQD